MKGNQETQAIDFAEQAKKVAAGKLLLECPIKSGSDEYAEVAYDFSKITGWGYADAMDCDPGNTNLFRISPKQALTLFAAAVSMEMPGVSAMDVKEQMVIGDSMNAIRIATAFFVASTRAASKRILSA